MDKSHSTYWLSRIRTFFLLVHIFKVTSSSTVATPVVDYIPHANSNCPGNDIRSLHENTPTDCAALCDIEPGCVAFVFQCYQPSPPQFCYLNHACAVEGLIANNGIHSYIKDTAAEEDMTSSPISDVEGTEMNFVWYTYSLDTEVYEAPLAVHIGGIMLVLLVGCVVICVLLDVQNCRGSCKAGYKNCLRGARDRKKKNHKTKQDGPKVVATGLNKTDGPSISGLHGGCLSMEDVNDEVDKTSSVSSSRKAQS